MGRGALAGPVIASAVILPPKTKIYNLKDSKKLNDINRRNILKIIKKKAIEYSIASASSNEIDKINIFNASLLAMKRAIKSLKNKPDYILIDGFYLPNLKINNNGIIKGDNKFLTISAASICAKVFRDDLMIKMSKKYKNYYFEKNKGYGTKSHIENIKKYNSCELHRKTFNPIKNFFKDNV